MKYLPQNCKTANQGAEDLKQKKAELEKRNKNRNKKWNYLPQKAELKTERKIEIRKPKK